MKLTEKPVKHLVISSSYGNDSVAMIQWVYENKLEFDKVSVVYIDTGWAAEWWPKRVEVMENMVRKYGFNPVRIKGPETFESLAIARKGFPRHGMQFCTIFLKGIPFLDWLDEQPKEEGITIGVGKRREESVARMETEEYVYNSEYHGFRTLWHPLYLHSESERNALLERAGVAPLKHRSLECSPCVNANRADIKALTEDEVVRTEALESVVGKTMFRPAGKMGAKGIRQVVVWANSKHGNSKKGAFLNTTDSSGCEGGLCGL